MCVGWRRLSTESAGVGERRLWLTGLLAVDIIISPINICFSTSGTFVSYKR